MKTRSLLSDLRNFFVGFAMGTANVIPGVSGGTMLFIMGAFEELVDAIRKVASAETLRMVCRFQFKALFRELPWRFLLGLGAGILISFATVAKLFVWLLENHPQLTYAFFFGLIVGSIVTVNRQLGKWTAGAGISFVVGAAVAFAVVSLVPVSTPNTWYVYLLCGAICIIAMILPGLSGSFLLLLFGQYNFVWNAVGNAARFQFSVAELGALLWLSLGCALGLGGFSHLLNYLMKRFRSATIAALIGFMVGSLPRIWPWYAPRGVLVNAKGVEVPYGISFRAPVLDRTFLPILIAAIVGLVLVLGIEMLSRKKGGASSEGAQN